MKQIVKERKDIAFYILLYPLPMHKDAYRKSKAIMCNKSLKMLDDAFDKKKIPDPTCETKAIDENMELAQKLGISATPALVFPDGLVVPGFIEKDKIISFIDKK
jgi:thiol:disulfide interchange protein DsbC